MGLVVMDLTAYENEGLRQLSCRNTYQLLDKVSRATFAQPYAMLKQLMIRYNKRYIFDTFKGTNTKDSPLAKYLLQLENSHKTEADFHKFAAKFYLLMKMHKSPVVGRPIVSTINSFTYHASLYVDAELKPLMTLIPSYLESSQQLIYDLNKLSINSTSSFICCADIESLYPNIPLKEGIAFVKSAIERLIGKVQIKNFQLRTDPDHFDFIMKLMEWVLNNNIFKFGNNWYKQLQGTAMGTPLAVPFACLFVAELEHRIFSYHLPQFKPIFYKRYIDDIFMITDSYSDANEFITHFNSIVSTIRCGSVTISETSGIFLDVEIYKGDRFYASNILDTRIYQKAQNRYLYLAPNSFHRRDIFKSTIISELNRYRLCCSNDQEFYNMKTIFYQRLIARGYNADYLMSVFPFHSSREQLLEHISNRFSAKQNQHSSSSNNTTSTLSVPPIFKSLNTYETTQLSLTKLLRIPSELQDLISNDANISQVLPQQPISCFCNSETSYNLIGNARKTLHK